ncbi:MAP10 protein, partial [Rhinopomastus cyanomelas]|nr:MAP10 protein [Rhinopomastus cyanomelas]
AGSLFTLELLVEAVRVEAAAVAPGRALLPALVLRPPGFPALLLRPADLSTPLCADRFCHWGRGKRCLVSLDPAANELQRKPGEPVSCGRRGRFPLRDVEGAPIGELLLGYRLCSLQATEEPPASPTAATPPHCDPEPVGQEEEEEEELEGNIFCPPMLYYSSQAAEPHLTPAAPITGLWEHIKVWTPQETDKGQTPPRPSAEPSLLHPTSSKHFHNALGQLPLLSALLAELSVLAQSTTSAAVHPHLAGLQQPPGMPTQPPSSSVLKAAEAPVGPSRSSGAASSQFKQGQQEATSTATSQAGKTVPQGETVSERNCKTKENKPPRKRLLYGMTKSLRLRLQQTNPDKLIIHEKREQYRKKQMEILKNRSTLSQRKLIRNAGKHNVVSCRHCSKGDSSKQKDQLVKTVQTSLQNSALTEYISVTDVSLDLQEQSIASLLENDEIAVKQCPWKATTAPLAEKMIVEGAQKENYAKTQLPAAFPSHANTKGSDEKATQLIHRKTTEHDDASVLSDHEPNSSRSAGNNSKFIEDFIASPENMVYSEDFTSAECTDQDSEAPNSSPESMWPESPKQGTSNTKSSRSRISETSQRAESTSDLLPVPSASSPLHSLKRNCDLKSSKRISGESVDSLTLAQMEASSLDEEQEAQYVKEENWGDEHLKQILTLTSKQVCCDTDLDIGKVQSFAEKSQAVTQLSSHLSSITSDLELGILQDSMSDGKDSFLEELDVPNQYKDISELVISKLPGYTM